MTREELLEEMQLAVTGGVLELMTDDEHQSQIIDSSLREITRYYDETTGITVPWSSCLDLENFDYVAIEHVYRAQEYGSESGVSLIDPLYAQQGNMIYSNGGTMYNLQDYLLNYASGTTMAQIRNTISTDLDWMEDRKGKKLYINSTMTTSSSAITIMYIPVLKNPEEVSTAFGQDMLVRMCIAKLKIEEGRIRKRYQLSNAPGSQDVDILTEGQTELKELRDNLTQNDNLIQIID